MVGRRAGYRPALEGVPPSPLPNVIRPGRTSDDSYEIRVPATKIVRGVGQAIAAERWNLK
jgi:hypothetical protein